MQKYIYRRKTWHLDLQASQFSIYIFLAVLYLKNNQTQDCYNYL